ncbi:uncharacterized protein LOC127847739 isoform X2 [Dreissena polymorpha]|uniref:NACHT domain-containing protein n=1 Tax=Dreissena polymorpha TaxID=45954 RepID=A0A9D4DPG4_DREPO|nr:uncharacterized protein LOC127847739 isoform X2 [Dreissena polymorpha]KAH3752461.1 hypothetical protein DPMN_187078 [Dreissena polymorpha]
MKNMAATEPFSETETCPYIGMYVTDILTPIWFSVCIGLITCLTFKSCKRRYTGTNVKPNSAAINITLELKSTINQFSETFSRDIRMTNKSQIEEAIIHTQQKFEDTKMALEENQHDCAVEVLSAIKKTNASLSAEVKSITTKLSECKEESLMYTRQMVADALMALDKHQQVKTTEVLLTTTALSEQMDAAKNEVINEIWKTKQTEHPVATEPDEYSLQRDEFREKLIWFYKTTKITVSVSPIFEGRDKPIWNIFVLPILNYITLEKDGSRRKTGNAVHQYKDIFYSHDKLHRRVFIQGEPGMGKSTFMTKLALDWCEAALLHNPENTSTFSDVDTLNGFKFLFHISLRDAMGQREVIQMIKTQIIDMHRIYGRAE